MPTLTAHFKAERRLLRAGQWPVAGVDEAGRGPLAGPVTAAAVILDPGNIPKGLADSKTLSAARRDALAEDICARALAVCVASSPAALIDEINIRQATFHAMTRALAGLALAPAHALIDGRDVPPGLICPASALVKGDATSLSIAAASIIAKTARDRLMRMMAAHYPVYGFARHMGYPVPAHLAALAQHGPCPLHRKSFAPVRNIIGTFRKNSGKSAD